MIVFAYILTINYNSRMHSQYIKFSITNTTTYSQVYKIPRSEAGRLPSAFTHFAWMVEVGQDEEMLPQGELVAMEQSEISSKEKHFYSEISLNTLTDQ